MRAWKDASWKPITLRHLVTPVSPRESVERERSRSFSPAPKRQALREACRVGRSFPPRDFSIQRSRDRPDTCATAECSIIPARRAEHDENEQGYGPAGGSTAWRAGASSAPFILVGVGPGAGGQRRACGPHACGGERSFRRLHRGLVYAAPLGPERRIVRGVP